MKFLNQIKAEAKNMILSKFILISAVLIFAFITVVVPVLGYVFENYFGYNYYPYDEEYVIVDGVEYENNNDFTHNYTYINRDVENMAQWMSPEALVHATEVSNRLLDFYAQNIPYAAQNEREYDYREWLSYNARENIIDIYVLEQEDLSDPFLIEGIQNFGYSEYFYNDKMNGEMYGYGMVMPDVPTGDETEEVVPLTEAEKQELILENQAELDRFNELMKTDNYQLYVDIQKEDYAEQIESSNERIAQLEKDIIENPEQEEYISNDIKYLEDEIEMINSIYLPQLDYRLQNGIINGDGSWEDSALSSIENSYRQLGYTEDVYTEEEFSENYWMAEEYGTYEEYLVAMEFEIQEIKDRIFIAETSLAASEPDMSFVRDGARSNLYSTFYSAMVVVVFAILVGGWCLASEFQNGTVRLMMIRPRTRMKVLLSRYFAGLSLVFGLYVAIFFIMFIVSGVSGGFNDYFYPNFTATGPVNFFATFFGDFFIVFISVIFMYTLAFMCSALIRNTAMSIILPIIVYVAAIIAFMMYGYEMPAVDMLAFTPAPYLLMQDYIGPSYYIDELVSKGMPISMELGAAVLIIYSAICLAISAYVFKKRDITN